MTPLQKGYDVFESGAFPAILPTLHAQDYSKLLVLIAKWDASAVDFSKTTFLQ
jgi:hypothetical protein